MSFHVARNGKNENSNARTIWTQCAVVLVIGQACISGLLGVLFMLFYLSPLLQGKQANTKLTGWSLENCLHTKWWWVSALISEGFAFRSHPTFTISGSAFELHRCAAMCCVLCSTHLEGSRGKNYKRSIYIFASEATMVFSKSNKSWNFKNHLKMSSDGFKMG